MMDTSTIQALNSLGKNYASIHQCRPLL